MTENNTTNGWRKDTRATATAEGRVAGWIHETGETLAVRTVADGFEVVRYPEQVADYMGFVEIVGEETDRSVAVSCAEEFLQDTP